MLSIYQTINGVLHQTETIEKGVWINLISPTEAEINQVVEKTGLDSNFLRYPLDDEELPRTEIDEGQLLIIINVPVVTHKSVIYDVIPLGIILNDDFIVTVCLEDVNLYQELADERLKSMATFKKTRFVLQLIQRKTTLYIKYLRDINRRHENIEKELRKSTKNQELFKLLNLDKSLVYFSTSLRSNNKVMEKLLRGKYLKMYDEDEDLLEDVLIENKQAIEMADIYSNITSGTMDAFASIISNNLNIVMKFLAGITIVLSIPTMIASFFGMNVPIPMGTFTWGFLIIIGCSAVLCLIIFALLKRKNMI